MLIGTFSHLTFLVCMEENFSEDYLELIQMIPNQSLDVLRIPIPSQALLFGAKTRD